MVFGGVQNPPTKTAVTEEYDGSSWTNGGSLINIKYNHGGGGSQTAAIAFGGQINPGAVSAITEGYDGTAWSTRPSMGTARSQVSGSSGTSNTAAIAFGGTVPPYSAVTEEFTGETTVNSASNIY